MIYLIDYVMGMIMWTLIGRVAMNIFQREDSSFFFMKVFVKLTDPFITMFRFIIRLPAIKLKGINATSMIKIFVIKSDLKESKYIDNIYKLYFR